MAAPLVPTVSHPELARLLGKAIERQAATADAVFTEDDLVAVGREIGIAPEVTLKALTDLRAHRRAPAPIVPAGTQVELISEPDRFALRLPGAGFRAKLVPTVLTTGLFTVFGSFCFLPSMVRQGAVLLGIPFLAIGGACAAWLLRACFGALRLDLAPGGGLLTIRGPLFTRRIALRADQLRIRRSYDIVTDAENKTLTVTGTHLVLDHGARSYPFGRLLSHTEQDWILDALTAWLEAAPR